MRPKSIGSGLKLSFKLHFEVQFGRRRLRRITQNLLRFDLILYSQQFLLPGRQFQTSLVFQGLERRSKPLEHLENLIEFHSFPFDPASKRPYRDHRACVMGVGVKSRSKMPRSRCVSKMRLMSCIVTASPLVLLNAKRAAS